MATQAAKPSNAPPAFIVETAAEIEGVMRGRLKNRPVNKRNAGEYQALSVHLRQIADSIDKRCQRFGTA